MLSVSPDGSYIAVITSYWPHERIYLFGLEDNEPLWTFDTTGGPGGWIHASSNNILADLWGNLYLFEFVDNVPRQVYYQPGRGHLGSVVSADGNYIAVCHVSLPTFYSGLLLFSKDDNDPLWSYTDSMQLRHGLAISADGGFIAANATNATYPVDFHEGRIYLFSKQDNVPLWSYGYKGEALNSLSISSDGSYITASTNSHVYFFSKESGVPLWSWGPPGRAYINSTSLSADGNYIAVGTGGGPAPNIGGSVYLFDKAGDIVWFYHHEVKPYRRV
jgi:hypothetical protein